MSKNIQDIITEKNKVYTLYTNSKKQTIYLENNLLDLSKNILDAFFETKENNLTYVINKCLNSLSEIEKKAIEAGLNTNSGRRKSFAYISNIIGYSDTWTAVKFNSGLRKLKHPSRSRQIIYIFREFNKLRKKTYFDDNFLKNYLFERYKFEVNLFRYIFGEKFLDN